ncbi:Dihydropteroate synthase [Dyadobacter sp. CECT 9623]|uniref:dihydropteroate synthase n=1 Tax=Dyadobacter linearis TaxID=2823330 RepID=A0ABM8UMV1_9BACT|nr:dihydropteroate synthase [Dyadobacter sp. CECT 9623]CAG5068691.1 Dihydropteroate synthase [Dyadobacter sp. CECT 9623]
MLQVSKKSLNIRGKIVDLTTPLVMGILNVTQDSFFRESRVTSENDIIGRAETMLEEGAAIIDIGGYSTRPGAKVIDIEEESASVLAALQILTKQFPGIIISVDTFRSEVAKRAVEYGASIINDVSGGTIDESMFATVAEARVPYILMHMRGEPQTMSKLTSYDNLVIDILQNLQSKIAALRIYGLADIIVDPGFGFAKNSAQNFELIRRLSEFQILGCTVLAGLSRKSTISKTLGITADEALNGTTVLNTLALQQGASMLRVHDVKAAVEAVKLWSAVGDS